FREIEVFRTSPNDAGIVSIDSPNIPSCTAPDVWVTLINDGSNVLNSVNFNWSVNGAAQPTLAWSGNLDSLGGTTSPIWIGTFAFSPGDVLRVWTSDPNGQQDSFDENDTLEFVVPIHQIASLPSLT